jgi:hypothetical protein
MSNTVKEKTTVSGTVRVFLTKTQGIRPIKSPINKPAIPHGPHIKGKKDIKIIEGSILSLKYSK